MLSPVFQGVGSVAYKYYMLFQHHTPPAGEAQEDPSWVIGRTPGQYVGQRSRSVYARLGKNVGFLGVDARMERTRYQINHPETYDDIFHRLEQEVDASKGEIKHVVILLGVPIAYPRLVWLETILSSPIFGFLAFLNRRFGIASGLFNRFDNEADLLDDLDDHYCSRHHKKERNDLIRRFQQLSKSRNVRITFLSGDVHLAAIGRFYSLPRFNIAPENDHRYMVNVISSAITNKPPPTAVSNLLARRNKVHHFDPETDEQLLDFFDTDVKGEERVKNRNTMPRRNFCLISDGQGSNQLPEATHTNGDNGNAVGTYELGAGAAHPAANAGTSNEVFTADKALNVAIRVEIDKKNPAGATKAYGFTSEIFPGNWVHGLC